MPVLQFAQGDDSIFSTSNEQGDFEREHKSPTSDFKWCILSFQTPFKNNHRICRLYK